MKKKVLKWCDLCHNNKQEYALLGGAMRVCGECFKFEMEKEETTAIEQDFVFSNPHTIKTFTRTD
jgi:ribosome-binding protein aMBF1 (putative translation factor)